MTIISQPSSLSFTGTMPDLVLKTTLSRTTVVVSITYSGGTAELLSETYWPDSDGLVTLSSLGELLDPYCRQYGSVTVKVEAAEYDAAATAAAATLSVDLGTVLFGDVDPQMNAADFCSEHFLTVLNGEKITAIGRTECLSAYDVQTLAVSVVLYDGGKTVTKGITLSPVNNANQVYDFNVSPQYIYDLAGGTTEQLVGYTATAGQRSQSYRVITDEVPPAPALVFLNSFGCWEYIYCTGTHSKDSKYTRSSAMIGRRRRNYKIVESREFKALTGWLNQAMADWADDLFRSQSVFLYTDGKAGKEIIITDSKSEITSEDDNMPSFEFTWSYAQKLHNVMDAQMERVRVFDNTFDYTFE